MYICLKYDVRNTKILSMGKKIVQFIRLNLKDSEFDNLLLLVRCFILSLILYGIVITTVIFIDRSPAYGVIGICCLLFLVLLFFMSYRADPRYIALVVVLAVDTYAFICGVSYGAAASFQQVMFMCLFILWYDITRSTPRKILWSVLTGVAICYIRAVEKTGTGMRFKLSPTYATLSYTNNIFCIIGLSMIAWFFCTQFADVERKLYLSNRELRKISHTDPLTKLMNRRFAEEEFKELEANYNKQENLISIAIGDIDFFKNVNDTYGHDAGDHVLSTLAAKFETFMKDYGFVVRWGGEEFLFVFENSNGDNAYIALEKLRSDIEQMTMTFKDQQLKVTMTFGVEEYGPLIGMDNTIKEADKKLYLGKSSGRNKVVY